MTIVGAGTANITGSQVGDNNYLAAANVSQALSVRAAAATVTIASLAQTYNGSARPVTVTTVPVNLPVTVTYNGNSIVPTNAGSYAVVATIISTNYTGNASNLLVVAKASQTITFGALAAKTYGDATFTLTATASSGLSVSYASDNAQVATVTGTMVTIAGAGTVNITTTQVGDNNYLAAANVSQPLTVRAAAATVTIANLGQTYNGSARPVTVTTVPANLPVAVTYDSNSVVPTNAGSYAVVATIISTNYTGNASNLLVVAKASQTITFGALAAKTYGEAAFSLSATASSGLAVGYVSDNPQVATVSGSTVTIVGAGIASITATQVGDDNHLAAANVSQALSVGAAAATVTIANLSQTYNGSARPVTVTTVPGNLPVAVTYNGSGLVPTNAGIYAVVAGLTSTNYAGSASNTLVIAKATPTVTATGGTFVYDGTAKAGSGSATGVDGKNLTATLSYVGVVPTVYGPTATAPTSAGSYTITASTIGDGNHTSGTSPAVQLTIAKASASLALANLNQSYQGVPLQPTVITVPAGLSARLTYGLPDSNDTESMYAVSTNPPVNIGIYVVVAALQDANYSAVVTNIFIIGQAVSTFTNSQSVVGIGSMTGPVAGPVGVGTNGFLATSNAVFNASVEVEGGGTLEATNSTFNAPVTVTNHSLLLAAGSTFTNTVTVHEGTIDASNSVFGGPVTLGSGSVIRGSGSLFTAPVSVESGGTLQGAGSVFRHQVAIHSGGHHAPGGSPGEQTFTNLLNYASGSALDWDLSGNTTTGAGILFDAINVTGGNLVIEDNVTLNLIFTNGLEDGTSSTVDWSNNFWDAHHEWTIIKAVTASASSGVFLLGQVGTDIHGVTLTTVRPGASFSVSRVGQDIVLSYAATTAAAVSLGNLSQTYNGAACPVTVVTVPANLAVNITYGGSAAAPTNAASYTVIANITQPGYTGSVTNTLVIARAAATLTIGNLSQTYNGTARPVTVITAPTNLPVTVTYNSSSVVPTNAGSYTVLVTVTDPNYTGSATDTLVITGAATRPTLSYQFVNQQLIFNWTGIATLQVQTNASGVGVNWVDYEGGGTPPVTVPVNPAKPGVFFRLRAQ